jgi:exodeoxyribonuclease V alpha subunit
MVHKVLRGGVPGIVITSFTRRAVSNIKRNVSSDLASNCLTIHKLLEYQPEYFEVLDEKSGEYRKTMQFLPARNQYNPLPPEIKVIIIEESSMVSVELFELLRLACPHDVQFIFLGDIQQLPPTFGTAILGYKMLELPTIELTEVYRQALDSPIIRLAHRILSGIPIPQEEYPAWKEQGKLTIHPWKKKLKEDVACMTAAAFLKQAMTAGLYDPDEDMILCPFNKSFGTVELNKHIADHLSKGKPDNLVHEIIAGFNKYYFSKGDRIMYEKEDGIIVSIEPNAVYMGKTPQKASTTLDYWGHDPVVRESGNSDFADTMDVELILSQMSGESGDDEEKVNQASHVITVQLADSGREMTLNTAAQINALILSYALTVHKSQGSEWRKVFILLHQSHATMIQRELLYTGVTRAREELYIICEPETFSKGITSQRIKGNTLLEKAEFFRGKLEGDTL